MSIGLFDSGVGGLSVLREVARELPGEDLLYFADSAHCPYGARSQGEVRRLTLGITRFLVGQGAKVLVVACNTASAVALAALRAEFDIPIVGMEPALKPAAATTHSGKVGVMATAATFQGELFARLVERFAIGVEVYTQAGPGLVEQVEAGRLDDPETERLLCTYLAPMLAAGIDRLVLGCTHYAFLTPAIRRIVGSEVEIIDPSPAVARQTRRVLEERSTPTPSLPRKRGRGREEVSGRCIFFTSGDPVTFAAMVERLIGKADRVIRKVDWVGGEIRIKDPSPKQGGEFPFPRREGARG
jgi:glutamate racemase